MNLIKQNLSTVENGWDKNPARAKTLHKDAYIDPIWFTAEQKNIFHRSWQYLCHENALGKAGDYVTTDIQGQSIIACRQKDGSLKAFYNVCKHRGHELLEGSGNTKRIICPYHAWTYDINGQFLEARQSRFIEKFNPKDFCLTPVKIEIFCHLVFVNLDTKAESLAKQSEKLGEEINHYAPDLADLVFAKRLTYTIKANWKSVVDNFLECYHCPVAHKDFCTLVDMDSYKVTTHKIYSSHMAKAGQSANKAYATQGATVTDHAVWYLWPNTTLMRYPGRGNFMIWRFIPLSPTETYEEFDFFFETADITPSEEEAIEFIDKTLQPEDIGLVESVQRGMQTPAYTQGRYMIDPEGGGMSEHAVHHFHSLVLQHYRDALKG